MFINASKNEEFVLPESNSRIAKNSIFLAVRMMLTMVISLYTARVFLSVLGVIDYGIFNVVAGFVTMFAFLNNAMITGIQRFYNFELGKNGIDGGKKVFITSILSQLALSIIIVALTETAGLWYIYNQMVIPHDRFIASLWIFQFSVLSLVLSILAAPYAAAIMAHEKMDYYAYVSIFDSVGKLLIALVLAYVHYDRLIFYGALLFLVSALDFILYAIYARNKFQEVNFELKIHSNLFKELVLFSGWNIFGKLAIMVKEQGLNMILNIFFGPVVNAARGIAFQINSALAGFVSSIATAVKPQMTQSYAQGNKQRTFHLMFSMSKLCYIILLFLAVPVCLEISFILKLWLGNNVPKYTSIFAVLVVLTTFVNNLNAPVSYVVHATGNMKLYQTATGVIEIFMLPVAYMLLKKGGEPWTVFLVAFVFVTIGQAASLVILNRIEPFSIKSYCKRILFPLISLSTASSFVGYTTQRFLSESCIRVVMVTATSFFSTLILSYVFVLNASEKHMVGLIVSQLKKIKLCRQLS